MSTPTTALANSIDSCSESLKFLRHLEKQLAQADAKAAADLRDARIERDNAIKHSRTSQVELETEKQTVARYKSSLIQAERTIEEQTDIISRLHREVTHWKEQARNWQEHFTRVEEERCSLATRLDEMLAEQSQTYGPLISSHLFPQISEASISAPILKQPMTPGSLPNPKKNIVNKSKTQPNSADTTPWPPASPRKAKGTSSRTKINSAQTNKSSDTSSTYPPSGKKDDPKSGVAPSRLVRRVQAVIRVKSEEEDNGELSESFANDDNYVPPPARKPNQSLRSSRKSKQTTQANNSQNSDAVVDSDDEDELILGSENSRRNIVVHPNTNPPAKKRKLNTTTTTRQKPSKKD